MPVLATHPHLPHASMHGFAHCVALALARDEGRQVSWRRFLSTTMPIWLPGSSAPNTCTASTVGATDRYTLPMAVCTACSLSGSSPASAMAYNLYQVQMAKAWSQVRLRCIPGALAADHQQLRLPMHAWPARPPVLTPATAVWRIANTPTPAAALQRIDKENAMAEKFWYEQATKGHGSGSPRSPTAMPEATAGAYARSEARSVASMVTSAAPTGFTTKTTVRRQAGSRACRWPPRGRGRHALERRGAPAAHGANCRPAMPAANCHSAPHVYCTAMCMPCTATVPQAQDGQARGGAGGRAREPQEGGGGLGPAQEQPAQGLIRTGRRAPSMRARTNTDVKGARATWRWPVAGGRRACARQAVAYDSHI